MKADVVVVAYVAVVVNAAHTGSCLCGAVSYRAVGLCDIWYCHCRQSQKLPGRYIAAPRVSRKNLEIRGEANWLPISRKTRSGYCKSFSSYMFWDMRSFDTISILEGSIDKTQGLDVKGHVYTFEKAGYYDITDGLPQYDTYPPEGTR